MYHYTEVVQLQCEVTSWPMPETVTWSICWTPESCDKVEVNVVSPSNDQYFTVVSHNLELTSSNSSNVTIFCETHNKLGHSVSQSETLNVVGNRTIFHLILSRQLLQHFSRLQICYNRSNRILCMQPLLLLSKYDTFESKEQIFGI